MRWRYIINVVAVLVLFLGVFMALPALVELAFGGRNIASILNAMWITIACGLAAFLLTRSPATEYIGPR